MSIELFRKIAAEAQTIKVVDPNPGVAQRAESADKAYIGAENAVGATTAANVGLHDKLHNSIERANRTNSPTDLRTVDALKSQYPIKVPNTLGAWNKIRTANTANVANKWQQLAQLAPGVAGQAAGTASVLTRMIPEKYRDSFQAGAFRNLQRQAEGAADVAGDFVSGLGRGIKRTTPFGNAVEQLNRAGEALSKTWPLGNN